jgi:hypothetical protein
MLDKKTWGILLLFMLFSNTAYCQLNIFRQDSVTIGKTRYPAQLSIGGAIRLNYGWKTYDDDLKKRGGDFGFELFRMEADGECGNIYFSIQYRWYEYFNAIHHGYFGYHLSPDLDLEIGIHQVPFGILPYASHSFWFGATYYLGLEDDYDAGIKLVWRKKNWTFHGAFYKNPEYIDNTRLGRYSFDLVTSEQQQNGETNQANLRIAYDLIPENGMVLNIGISGEYGGIWNNTSKQTGSRFAVAVHADWKFKEWNLQLQGIHYQYDPVNPDSVSDRSLQFGAFMAPFMVIANANVLTFNIAKRIELNGSLIDNITFYNDFSITMPSWENTQNSIQNVTGCLVNKKGLYLYIDWISGQNMWFAGGPGIGLNEPGWDEWKGRLNVNFGYFFSSQSCR